MQCKRNVIRQHWWSIQVSINQWGWWADGRQVMTLEWEQVSRWLGPEDKSERVFRWWMVEMRGSKKAADWGYIYTCLDIFIKSHFIHSTNKITLCTCVCFHIFFSFTITCVYPKSLVHSYHPLNHSTTKWHCAELARSPLTPLTLPIAALWEALQDKSLQKQFHSHCNKHPELWK